MIELLNENPRIYRIMVTLPENPLKLLNSYVIMDGGETLMIDTGFNRPECWAALQEGMAELGITASGLKVVLTHMHSDHTGQVAKLIEGGATAYMSAIDKYLINLEGRWEGLERMFVKYGLPEEDVALNRNNQAIAFAPPKNFPATELVDGDVLRVGNVELECIHVPGHTPGQMVLYIRNQKILFSADHILFDITPNISVWGDDDHSLEDYLESLDAIAALDIERTFPGHREFNGNIYDRIASIKEHHKVRLQEVLDASVGNPVPGFSGGARTIYDIAAKISWSARGRKFVDFAPTQKWFAMGETLSHIFWLLHNGYISFDGDNHVVVLKRTVE